MVWMTVVHMMIKNNMMAINEIDDNDNNDALCEHRWRSDHNWNQVEIGTIFSSSTKQSPMEI